MGQIKNIKLHIVTDIKYQQTAAFQNGQSQVNCTQSQEECCQRQTADNQSQGSHISAFPTSQDPETGKKWFVSTKICTKGRSHGSVLHYSSSSHHRKCDEEN